MRGHFVQADDELVIQALLLELCQLAAGQLQEGLRGLRDKPAAG